MKFKKLTLTLTISTIALSLIIITEIINDVTHLKNSNNSVLTSTCDKVWAHRGYTKIHEQNSIDAFQSALNIGAGGSELDIFYDEELADFIVSHDRPYNKKNGELLLLNKVFKTLNSRGKFWLDFKNLSSQNEKESLNKLIQLDKKYNLKSRVIIESKSLKHLKNFTNYGFTTSYWIEFNEKYNEIQYIRLTNKIKLNYFQKKFSAISTNHEKYSRHLQSSLKNIPTLLFTVNTDKAINEYLKLDNIKIILTDEKLFNKNNNCNQKNDTTKN